jgi:hypothetical protein
VVKRRNKKKMQKELKKLDRFLVVWYTYTVGESG